MIPFVPDEIDALRALVRIWPNARMVVLGASALRCFMPLSWRTTEDLDLSVAASLEDAASALALLPGWSPDPRQEQRWRTPAGIAVDIVPASPDDLARGYVEWPRTGSRMSLLGMRLAFERGVALRVVVDLVVRVVPLHVLAVLKMVAYLDRPEIREKDLGDLAHVLHGYIGDDSDRRFSPEVPDDLSEFEDVSPYLLGRDVGAVVNAEERGRVLDFVATILDEARGPRLQARLSVASLLDVARSPSHRADRPHPVSARRRPRRTRPNREDACSVPPGVARAGAPGPPPAQRRPCSRGLEASPITAPSSISGRLNPRSATSSLRPSRHRPLGTPVDVRRLPRPERISPMPLSHACKTAHSTPNRSIAATSTPRVGARMGARREIPSGLSPFDRLLTAIGRGHLTITL